MIQVYLLVAANIIQGLMVRFTPENTLEFYSTRDKTKRASLRRRLLKEESHRRMDPITAATDMVRLVHHVALYEETGCNAPLDHLGILVDILVDNQDFRRTARYNERIYNSSLGLANLFQINFGYSNFERVSLYCAGCGQISRGLTEECCPGKHLLRPCGCNYNAPFCDFCGNNGYAGLPFLVSLTEDTLPFGAYNEYLGGDRKCHQVKECISIEEGLGLDVGIYFSCTACWTHPNRSGHGTFMEAGHYTSYWTYNEHCHSCHTPLIECLEQDCWMCDLTIFHNPERYQRGDLTLTKIVYSPNLKVRTRAEKSIEETLRPALGWPTNQ